MASIIGRDSRVPADSGASGAAAALGASSVAGASAVSTALSRTARRWEFLDDSGWRPLQKSTSDALERARNNGQQSTTFQFRSTRKFWNFFKHKAAT